MDGNIAQYEAWISQNETRERLHDAVQDELEKRKRSALRKLARYISPTILTIFSDLLVEAYKYDSENAMILMDQMNISKQEIRALDDNDFLIEEDLYEDSVQLREEMYG